MALFRKSKDVGQSRQAVRDGGCIYSGEAFPRRGEPMAISGIEVTFLLDRSDLPVSWTELAEAVRQRTGEPAEQRVLKNILGTMLAMVENKLESLGQGLKLSASAQSARSAIRRGADSVDEARTAFAGDPRGAEYFDFEVIKIASLLATAQASDNRTSAGWPHPDVWGGDVNAFPYPY